MKGMFHQSIANLYRSGCRFVAPILIVIFTLFGSAFFLPQNAWAVDEIILRYGAEEVSITLEELDSFANRGSIPSVFTNRLNMSQKDIDDLREALQLDIDVNLSFLEKALDSDVGNFVLEQIGEVLGQRLEEDLQTIADAMIAAAADDSLSLLEVMDEFPNPISVDGRDLTNVYQQISFVAEDLREVIAFIDNFLEPLVCEDTTASYPLSTATADRHNTRRF